MTNTRTVNVFYRQNTLSVHPDKLTIGKKETATVVWRIPGNPPHLTRILNVTIGNGWSPDNTQPVKVDAKTWTVCNPNTTSNTYKYAVTAYTSDGTQTLDPEIENEGQGGPGDDCLPSPGS